jgi:hypothetical protein
MTEEEITDSRKAKHDVKYTSLLNPKHIHFLELHIKVDLRLMKIFKVTDQNGMEFLELQNKFPKVSDPKIKEEIFVSSEIMQLINVSNLMISLMK